MFKSERQKQIAELLRQQGYTTVKQLSQALYASQSSIRRDLSEMEKQQILKRSYGGAELITSSTNVTAFGARSDDHLPQKQVIAAKAVTLIRPGDIVFLDQSSTCYCLALAMTQLRDVTVVTNNIEILKVLAGTELTVIATGGTVSKSNPNCLLGTQAQQVFEGIYADLAFFSARSLSTEGIITDCVQEEIFLRSAMLRNARKKVFLCNQAKFHTVSAYIQCDLSQIDTMICEDNPGHTHPFARKGLQIL